ncbi:MAG: hypothetical protein IJ529_02575 [Alphaproteobacteria bacterium]|nr:hypothetical protein [Alphaproteobacteria bacterium]
MKKILYILFTAVFLCACGQNDEKSEIDIVVFTQQGCIHCAKAMSFIYNDVLNARPDLKIKEIDITYERANLNVLKRYLKRAGFPGGNVGTPIIFYDDQMLMGWSIENKAKMKKAFILGQTNEDNADETAADNAEGNKVAEETANSSDTDKSAAVEKSAESDKSADTAAK